VRPVVSFWFPSVAPGQAPTACPHQLAARELRVQHASGCEETEHASHPHQTHLRIDGNLRELSAECHEAEQWLWLVPGLEGVVAKRADSRYLPGQRGWVKVKRQRTADCVVIGLAGDLTRPALVLGLRGEDGELHHLGRPGSAICHFESRV
jgi:hypothetical protein